MSDQKTQRKKRIDVNKTISDMPGMAGFLDTLLKRFRNVTFAICLSPIALMYLLSIGISLMPGVALYDYVSPRVADAAPILRYLAYGCTFGMGYLMYVFTIIFVVPIFNIPVKPFVKPYRGMQFDLRMVPWFMHNALTYLPRYTFLEFLTASPFNTLFYKMMGMKIGRGVIINTANISDPCLIQLDDYVTIGGSVTMFAHYGMQGYMVVDRVHIKERTTIGLKASIFGGVTIGARNVIAPHSLILPKTVIPDGEK